MSERYTKLFALPENLYCTGAPVVIAAGALQKDNQTDKVFAQLKLRSIQDKVIKAATVQLTPFDTVGHPLDEPVDYQYLDLSARRDSDFGQKTPVPFPNAATRSFSVAVVEVVFRDNSLWTASDGVWETLSAPVTPEGALVDSELAKQYRLQYGEDCRYIFQEEKNLWQCVCGAVNHDREATCHQCQRVRLAISAPNTKELKVERDARLVAEHKQAAEKKAAAKQRAKQTKKIAAVIAAVAVIFLIVGTVIFNYSKAKQEEAARLEAYQTAIAYMEAEDYENAIHLFEQLGDYQDSAARLEEAMFSFVFLNSDGYKEAERAFFSNMSDTPNEGITIKYDPEQKAVTASLIIPKNTVAGFSFGDDMEPALVAAWAGVCDSANSLSTTFHDRFVEDGYPIDCNVLYADPAGQTLYSCRNGEETSNVIALETAVSKAKEEAYAQVTSLVDGEKYQEAYDYWNSVAVNAPDSCFSLDYKDLSDYYHYSAALKGFLNGDHVSLVETLDHLKKVSSDFKDTKKYAQEISSVYTSIHGLFIKPIDNLSECRIEIRGEEAVADYYWPLLDRSVSTVRKQPITWVVEDGKILRGELQYSAWTYTITPASNALECKVLVNGEYDEELSGLYTKSK